MKKYNNKRTLKEIQDCLDSDDELPMTYTERTELPAYLDDDRFDDIGDLIEFPWLNLNTNQPNIHQQKQDQEDNTTASIQTASETNKKKIEPPILTTDKEPLTKKGIFEEWKSTTNHTPLQTNKTGMKDLTFPLTTHGHIMINKGFLDEHEQDITSESKQAAQETGKMEDIPLIFPPSINRSTFIKRGILKEQDIICMKSFAAQTTDESALLWFIDFLINKDLQSEYKFLKSCLVVSQNNSENSIQMYSQTVSKSSSIKFDLLVI